MFLPDFRSAHFPDEETLRLARLAWGLCVANGSTLQVGGEVPDYLPGETFEALGWDYIGGRWLFFVGHHDDPARLRDALANLIGYLMTPEELARVNGACPGWLPEQPSRNGVLPDGFLWAAAHFFGQN